MKKVIYMAMVAIAALSSCSKNDPILSETGKQALIFTATMEGNATRATYNSTNRCAEWEAGDQISINGKTYSAQSAGLTTTFKAATEGQEATGSTYNAYFACTYDGTTATLPAEITETWAEGKFNMPMFATSTTTYLSFKNLCGVLKITVKSDQLAAVKKIKVSSATKAVSGAFTVTSDAAVLSDASTVANTLTITYTEAVPTTAEGKVFYVAVPAQTYQALKIELDADGNGFTKSMTTKSATEITVARKTIYPIDFADNALPAGALLGVFTVGNGTDNIAGTSDDVKVYFSKGNLQAKYNGNGLNYIWGFAANQYDCIGDAAGNTTITAYGINNDNAIVDLFGWSIDEKYGINISTRQDDYLGDFKDWGEKIGGGNTWRTLSMDEWVYLFNTRSASTVNKVENARYAKATVNNVYGVILLPDSYTHPAGVVALTNINKADASFDVNTYDISDWTKLESAGAVFLPAAGGRSGSVVSYFGTSGHYWSSTVSTNYVAYDVDFNSSSVTLDHPEIRQYGCSVRLITDAN